MASFDADLGLHLRYIGHVRSELRDVLLRRRRRRPVPVMDIAQRSSANTTMKTNTMTTSS